MRMGVNIIYQEFNLIPYMDVAHNIFSGRFKTKFGLLDHKKMHAEAADLLGSLNMHIDTRALITDLSTAEQQMVEIAKALSIQSTALIMDEPTSALSERETEQLFATIHQLNETGDRHCLHLASPAGAPAGGRSGDSAPRRQAEWGHAT